MRKSPGKLERFRADGAVPDGGNTRSDSYAYPGTRVPGYQPEVPGYRYPGSRLRAHIHTCMHTQVPGYPGTSG
eukprot:1991884-Rhodomonas_salina.1